MVSESGGTEEDLVARIRKAQQAFATLRSVWKSRAVSLNTKLRIFNSNKLLANDKIRWKAMVEALCLSRG